jgi:hypothetical protein
MSAAILAPDTRRSRIRELQSDSSIFAPSVSPTPRSSLQWRTYFEDNAAALMDIPWERGAGLTPEERETIAESLQIFQIGESSEGRHLLNRAQEYAERANDPEYVVAVKLFIHEEQRHGRDLGRFLTLAGVPLLKKAFTDSVFRWLRHRAGLEVSIAVVIVAEAIANVYYAALRDATGSDVLRTLCEQILRDEVAHVSFQSERLAILRRDRSRAYNLTANGLHRFLYGGTCLVVWWKHGPVIKAGGVGFRRFWTWAWRELNIALRQMDPRGYAFADFA